MISILIFLLAIILANLSVAYFGPVSTPFNAFILIGLDLSMRDRLHEAWHGRGLVWKMFGLIVAGAVITYVLNRGSGMIGIASVIAFGAALIVDALLYQAFWKQPRFHKMNYSNMGSAAVDSILFPTIAFGGIIWWVILGQFAAKVIGGAFWAWVFTRRNP